MAKASKTAGPVPETVKLTDAARSLGMLPREFKQLLAANGLPILRPSAKRERVLVEHMKAVVHAIAEPALPEAV